MSVSRKAGLLLLLLLFPFRTSRAQAVNARSNSPLDSKQATNDSYPKEPYVFELIENRVQFEGDGKGHRDFTIRARIQSESAVREFGLLVYPYASSFESLDVLYVRVHKPDGTSVETPSSDIQELDSAVSREAPMYTDQREKHIAVKSLATGDVLEAHFRWTVHDPIAPGHFWFDHSYFRAGICIKEILQIDVPANVPVKFRNSGAQPSLREEGGRRIYTFTSSNLKKEEESKIPQWEKDFHGASPPDVELSSFTSWEDVGNWFGSLEQAKAVVTPEIRAKAEELTKGKTSEDEKLRAIYSFVSTRFRYIGIDLGLGRYTPHAASEVLVNRYGDCKDKHTLFAALLQAAGIRAYPVLISSKYRVDPSFPTMSLFDHVITAIPQGDALLFSDTTPEVAPFGLLTQNIRDRKALVIPGSSTARMVTTPADPPFLNFEHVQIDASIDVGGTLDAKMRFEDRGDSELVLRLAYRATPQNRWPELTQNIVARMGFAGTVSDVSVAQPEDTEKPFWISFSYHRTDFPDWKNHRMLLPAPPFFLPDLTEEQKLSKEPLPIGSPQDVKYDSTVKLPEGFSVVLPGVPEQKTDFAEFTAAYTFEKGVLHGTLHLKTLQHEIPGNKRGEFSKMVKAVDEAQRRFIFVGGNYPIGAFLPNPNLLVTGKPEELIPVLEKALANDPDNDTVLLRLSQAYSDAGRTSDAVAVLQRAISHHTDVPRHLLLALGFAYLRVPDAENAMVEFKKGLGDDPGPDELNDVAYSLAEANVQLDDALSYSKRAVSSLAAQTMDISPDEAGPSDFGLMPKLAATWDTLGWIQFRKGNAGAAEKYLEAAWQLMQSPAIGEHLVEVYEKLGRKQKAAAVCNMAEAALGATTLPPDAALRQKIGEEMKRLLPLLTSWSSAGPSRIRARAPDAHVALADMRSLNIPLSTKLRGESARANFVISIGSGSKADNVVFLSGSEELRNAIAAIAAVKYPQTFPDDTPVRILRKASLNCSVYAKDCQLFFTTVQEASGPTPVGVPVKEVKILGAKTPPANPPPSGTDSDAASPKGSVETKPHVAQALFEAARRAQANGDYAGGARILEQVVEKDPKHKMAWNQLGWVYNKLGEYEKAERALRKATELDPQAKFAHNNLGEALAGQKKYKEAIPEYEKEIAINARDRWAHANLGRVYVLIGEYDKAIGELETAATITPDDPAIYFNMGRAYGKTGQPEKAARQFGKSADLDPIPARWNAVAYEMALENLALDQAQRYAELAIAAASAQTKEVSLDQLSNHDVTLPASLSAYWDTLGWVKFQQGNIKDAEKYVRSAWQVRSIGEIGDHLGQIYEKEGRKTEATQMYAMALTTSQPVPDTRSRLAALLGSDVDIARLTEEARGNLAKSHAIQIRNVNNSEGIAEFWVLLQSGGKASATKFISGDEALRPFTNEIAAAPFPDTFPDSTDIKLLRRGKLTCLRSSASCTFLLMSVETIRSPN
ncbi:MAG TPA: DUF3857 domain-containing protein [Candidatus Acidoferrum sp.]